MFLSDGSVNEESMDNLITDLKHTAQKHDITYEQALAAYKAFHLHLAALSAEKHQESIKSIASDLDLIRIYGLGISTDSVYVTTSSSANEKPIGEAIVDGFLAVADAIDRNSR